jgi:hypothetical protein
MTFDEALKALNSDKQKQAVSLLAKIVGRFVRLDYSASSVQHANCCVVRARA